METKRKLQNELIKELKVKTIKKKYIHRTGTELTVVEHFDMNGNVTLLETDKYRIECCYINDLLAVEKYIFGNKIEQIVSYIHEDNKKTKIVNCKKKEEYHYKKKLLIRKTIFNIYGNPYNTEYTYDKNNNRIRKEDDENIIEYKYNENNDIISKLIIYKNDNIENKETLYIYEDNKLTKIYSNGFKTEYVYNTNGLIDLKIKYDNENNITSSETYIYEFYK